MTAGVRAGVTPGTITLRNDFLEVSIDSRGAELKSVRDVNHPYEYMWQGHAQTQHWQRTAPVLFPVIGALKNQQMIYNDQTYTLKKHGFARDMDFDVTSLFQGNSSMEDLSYATFSLKSSDETLKVYPFEFELIIKYHLKERVLAVSYEVVNQTNETMWFSIGGHPGFNMNLSAGQCNLFFEVPEILNSEIIDVKSGLIEREFKPLGSQVELLNLTPSLFEDDALIFSGLQSHYVTLVDNSAKRQVSVSLTGVPKLGIWSDKGPFVCIEPWWGIADYVDATGQFDEKDYNQKLAPQSVFCCGYDLAFE